MTTPEQVPTQAAEQTQDPIARKVGDVAMAAAVTPDVLPQPEQEQHRVVQPPALNAGPLSPKNAAWLAEQQRKAKQHARDYAYHNPWRNKAR